MNIYFTWGISIAIQKTLSCLGKFTEIDNNLYFETAVDEKTFKYEFEAACKLHNQRVPNWYFKGVVSNYGTTVTDATNQVERYFKATSYVLENWCGGRACEWSLLDIAERYKLVNSNYESVIIDFSLDSYLLEWVKEQNLWEVFFIYKHNLNTNKPSKGKFGFAPSVPDLFYVCESFPDNPSKDPCYDVAALNNAGLLNVFIKEAGLDIIFERLYTRSDVQAFLLVNQF